MKNIFLLDNYDSFTYNLQHYLLQLNCEVTVKRNDETSVEEIKKINPDAIVFSPGPKTPRDAGVMNNVIKNFYEKIPMLGICLGHQALGEFFGAKLIHAVKPMHGKTSLVEFEKHLLFENIPNPFEVMRYHSLILEEKKNLPIKFIAHTKTNEPMALFHEKLPIAGFQFHPESILTKDGMQSLRNWKHWVETTSR